MVLEMFLFSHCFLVRFSFFSGSSILKQIQLHIFLLNSNRFLNFSFKMFQWLGLVSYKLVSYKEKKCFVGAFEAQIFLKKMHFSCCRCFSSTGFVTSSGQHIPLRYCFHSCGLGSPIATSSEILRIGNSMMTSFIWWVDRRWQNHCWLIVQISCPLPLK